jgi:hypothetical protein
MPRRLLSQRARHFARTTAARGKRTVTHSKQLLAALFFSLFALPMLAQVNDTYVVPAAANVPGGFGTRWQTRLSIFNPQSYTLRTSITLVPTGGAQGQEVLVDIPANAVALWDNALDRLFHDNGTGALLVATFPEDNPNIPDSVVDRAILVSSETYNNASSGTYGQTIPGIWTGLQDDGITAIAHGIRNVAAQGWRTNVGAVNLGRTSVTMYVTVFDYDGNVVQRDIPFVLPPLGHMQDRLPVEVDRGSLEFSLTDPSKQAVVFPYTSTIDQLSGDPAYQSPALLATGKALFGKTGMTEAQRLSPGKKIDVAFARTIRAAAKHLGVVAAQ